MNTKGSILVVDDTRETLALLTKLLNDEGYTTFSADSGELALVLLEKKVPDLILLDIRMPGIDGFEVCRRIKANINLIQIPVIFLSAANESNDRIEGYNLGAVDYINKPFEKTELLVRVNTHLTLYVLTKSLKEQYEEIHTQNEEYRAINEELEEAKERAEESEEKFSKAFNTSPYGIIITNPSTGQIIEVNDGFCKLSGFTFAEIKEKTTIELNLWRNENDRIVVVNDLKNSTIVQNREYCFNKKSGEILYGLFSAEVIFLKDKPYILSSINDISERKKTEKNLKESELKYRSLIENTSDAVFCVDEKCEYQFTNQAFAKTFGQTPAFFAGKTFWDVYPKAEADYRFETVKEMFRTGEVQSIEVCVPLPDKTLHFLAKANPIKDETGKVILNLTTATDITERKKAEVMLRDEKERIKTILNLVGDPIFVKDNDHRITYANQAFYKMFGLDENSVIGFTLAETVPENERQHFLAVDRKVLDTGIPDLREEELTLTERNRTIITRKIRFTDESGNKFLVGSIHDITERKNAENILKEKTDEIESQNEEYLQINEELIEAKERAEESERLKTAFLSNMSHEIRTPLNLIIGYSEFLAYENLPATERAEYISLINNNSTRLLNLINDILDLSRIQSGQKIADFKTFDINKLIDELFIQNKNTIENKLIELCACKGKEDKQAFINSSEQLIYQIFTNLINNAIKYSVSGKIDFGYKITSNELELFVKDTGIGMSKEYLSTIFTRFSQENSKLNRTYEGAGLGLSIVKGIVDLLNGTINVYSEKGKGTKFEITIPLSKPIELINEKQNSSEFQEKIQSNKKITLLVVEDDEASFRLLKKQILREFPCEIIHAVNGNIAIEKVNTHPEISCVLMDMHLPGIDGCETTTIIKKTNKDLPVFAVTAAVMDADKEKAFNAGCDAFFSKPIDIKKLVSLVATYYSDN